MIDLKAADRRSWAQLTYTSADSIAGVAGGWGVKEETGDGDAAVFAMLRDGVTTKIEALVDTPQFPTDQQLADRPRRLTFREVAGRIALWHACPAGQDATGRPGNVYTHAGALLEGDAGIRPIEYWRSASWLEPFGPTSTSAARLGDLAPGTTISRAAVLAFLAPGNRRDVLEAILAAVDHVVATNGVLALAVDDPDEAAHWIAAVTAFTTPGIGRRLSWTTYERGHRVEDPANEGLRIVCIPRADVEDLQRSASDAVLVLDPSWNLVEKDGQWVTPTRTFPAEPLWQAAMADTLTYDDENVHRILQAMDELGAQIPASVADELPPHWPLSMAMLSLPGIDVGEPAEIQLACLAEINLELLAVPLVRDVADQYSESISEDQERGDARAGLVTALAYAGQRRLVADYLSVGWDRGDEAPQVSPGLASLIRESLVESIAGVLRAMLLTMGNGPTDPTNVLARARLLTFVRRGLAMADEPTPQVESITSFIRGQLADPAYDAYAPQLALLDPDLLTARAVAPASVPPAAPAAPAPVRGYVDRFAPVTVGAAELDQLPVVAPPPVTAPPAAPSAQPRTKDDLYAALIRRDIGSDRYFGTVDVLRVSLDLRAVPLEHVDDPAPQDAGIALERYEATGSELMKDVLAGWLSLYWTLVEVTRADETPDIPPAPDAVRAILRDRSGFAVHEVVRYLREGPATTAGRLVYWSLQRQLLPPAGATVVGLMAGTGKRFGLSALEVALERLAPERVNAVLAHADLQKLQRNFGPQATDLFGSLGLAARAQQVPPAPDNQRGK